MKVENLTQNKFKRWLAENSAERQQFFVRDQQDNFLKLSQKEQADLFEDFMEKLLYRFIQVGFGERELGYVIKQLEGMKP